MVKRANGFVGLGLGREKGVLVEVDSEGKVTNVQSFPVRFEKEKLQNPDEFAVEMARLLDPVSATKVALVVEPLNYAIRCLELPAMPLEEMRALVEGEASQYIIFEGQPVFVAFSEEGEQESAEGRIEKVFLSAAAQPPLDDILDSIREKREVTYAAAPFTALLSFYIGEVKPEGTQALVMLGEDQSYFFGVVNQKIIFARSLDYGTNQFTEGGKEELLLECANTLPFFTNRESVEVEKVVVLGKKEDGLEFAQLLETRVGTEVTYFHFEEKVTFASEDMQGNFLKMAPYSTYAYAALELAREGRFPYNLLPIGQELSRELMHFLKRTLIPVPLLLLLFFIVGFGLQKKTTEQIAESKALQAKLLEVQHVKQKEKEIQDRIKTVEREISLAQATKFKIETTYPHSGVSTLFEGLQDLVPSSAWLERVEFADGVITFNGRALTQVSAAKFVERLSKARVCDSIGLASFERKPSGNRNLYDFSVHCQLKGGELS